MQPILTRIDTGYKQGNVVTTITNDRQFPMDVLSGEIQYVAGTPAANRIVKIGLYEPDGTLFQDTHAGAPVTANQTVRLDVMQGQFREAAIVNGALQMPIPPKLTVPEGWSLRISVDNGNAADLYGGWFMTSKVGGNKPTFAPAVDADLAYLWDFTTESVVSLLGAGTFAVTRANNTAWRINAAGDYELVNANLPRFSKGADGMMRLLVEHLALNDCVRSQDLAAGNWVAVGTPTIVSSAKAAGVLTLDLIGDDDAGALEGYTLASGAIGGTSGVAKPWSFHYSPGTSVKSVFRIRDTTAGVDRVLLTIEPNPGGLPVVTMTTGTHLMTGGQFSNGIFRISGLSAVVTAANNHSIEWYPASDAALAVGATGNAYFGGVNWFRDATDPNPSYILTAGATVTRNLDLIQINPFTMPAAGTVVCRGLTHPLAPADDATPRRMWSASDGTNNNLLSVVRGNNSAVLTPSIATATVLQTEGFTATISVNQVVTSAMAYATNDVAQSVNGGAVETDNTVTLPVTDRLLLGISGTGTAQIWGGGIEALAIYRARKPNATIRELALNPPF